MSVKQADEKSAQDANVNITPSTASRVKPVPVENAFPTPPRRDMSASQNGDPSPPVQTRLFGTGRSPKEHKSVEALRSHLSRGGNNSGRASAIDFDRQPRKEISQRKSQLFDQAFAVRESYYSARERVSRDSVIVVELRLNCCVRLSSLYDTWNANDRM